MRGLAVIAGMLVGCYAPNPQPGSQCVNGACPIPLVCVSTGTCERTELDSGVPGDALDDGGFEDAPKILIDGCSPSPEICGDGIDQDCDGSDPPCPANDLAAGAIDVTAGGNFTANLSAAHDNIGGGSCGGAGGRDVFYKITLNAAQVYYFDTFGSSFDTVVRVYAGACTAVTAQTPLAMCGDDSCGGKQTQLALALAAGTSCIVVDQKSSAETAGSVHLAVTPGGRNGLPLAAGMQTNAGNTCNATSVEDPDSACGDPGSKDVGYFFTNCPGSNRLLDAQTCIGSDANFDSTIYVRHAANELACSDDDCGSALSMFANAPITSAGLYWMIVDGFSSTDCGAYTLTTNLR
jgi:hypothetical protein